MLLFKTEIASKFKYDNKLINFKKTINLNSGVPPRLENKAFAI